MHSQFYMVDHTISNNLKTLFGLYRNYARIMDIESV